MKRSEGNFLWLVGWQSCIDHDFLFVKEILVISFICEMVCWLSGVPLSLQHLFSLSKVLFCCFELSFLVLRTRSDTASLCENLD
jgi:hypothetical protein